jgi:hypothetical protein
MSAAIRPLNLQNRATRRFCAVICLALFMVVELLALSPALHKDLHPNADSPSHHCAVTLFTHSQVTSAAVVCELPALVAILLFCLPPPKAVALPSVDYRLSPSRAPPSF